MSRETEQSMKEAIDHFKEEMRNIRTGRANPGMVENVSVEAYGTTMKIKELGSITTPEARTLLITPFDPHTTGAIGKGIEKANLGFMPAVDANAVRITIPEMDKAMREEMVKMLHRKLEECKVRIRNCRRDANERVRKQKADGEIGEDIQKKEEKNVQELTDNFCKQADELSGAKEKEISTI